MLSGDTSQCLWYVVSFADEATPTPKAKPAGVRRDQGRVKVGESPAINRHTGPEFLGRDTQMRSTADDDGAGRDKNARYALSRLNTRGEAGPWSETASATIGA